MPLCPQHNLHRYVPGFGNPHAKLMAVAEAPGYYEDKEGQPLIGPSGQLFDEMLLEAGMRRSEIYATNVLKYRPPMNKLELLHQIDHKIEDGVNQLWEEIDAIKPNAILAMGALAFHTLTGIQRAKKKGITQYRGSILKCLHGGAKVIPAYHPANFLYEKGRAGKGQSTVKYQAKYYTQLDFARAVEESKTSHLNLPSRWLQICKSSSDLYRFIEKYKGYRDLSIDIESSKGCTPVCIGLAFTPDHAISVPLYHIQDQDHPEAIPMHEMLHIWRMLAALLEDPNVRIIGQNFKYDHKKLERPCGFRIPKVYGDTLLLSHTIISEFPRSLEFLTSILTREPYYKNERTEFIPGKDRLETLLTYNARDAAVTLEVWNALLPQLDEQPGLREFFFDFVMPLHSLYIGMELEGMDVDEKERERLWDKYSELEERNKEAILKLNGAPVNLNSPKQIAIFLYVKMGLPIRQDTQEDTIVSLLGNNADTPEKALACNLIIDGRRIQVAKSRYIAAAVDFDGRMRGQWRIDGTENGRTSTKKLGPPERPLIGPKLKNTIGISWHGASKHGEIGGDYRRIFVAPRPTNDDPDEWEFLECDQSQAEARVVALFAEDYKLLELFNTPGYDVHKLTATWFFECQMHEVSEDMRFIGKTGRHMGAYDAHKHKFMLEVNTGARRFNVRDSSGNIIKISEWRAGKILDTYHRYTPRIRGVFHPAVAKALQDNAKTLRSGFGRIRTFHDRWDDSLLREAYACLPQMIVADQTKRAMLEIKKVREDVRFCIESHDAAVAKIKKKERKEWMELFKEKFELPIPFEKCSIKRQDLIIPCEIKVGDNYKDLKKVA